MKSYRTLLTALVCTVAVASTACGRKAAPVVAPTPAPAVVEAPPPPPPPPPPAPPAPPPAAPTEDELFARKTLDQLNAERPLNDVFFEFDKSTLRASEVITLDANARWMTRWASTKVVVEGHCDMRGTSEYNMALGDRRATATRDYLVSLGIAADRIMTVSKGEEEPVCREEGEECWSRNRRGHFLITAK